MSKTTEMVLDRQNKINEVLKEKPFSKCEECDSEDLEEVNERANDLTDGQESELISRELNGEHLFRCMNCRHEQSEKIYEINCNKNGEEFIEDLRYTQKDIEEATKIVDGVKEINFKSKIYLAGKISISGWRHSIVKGLRNHDYWGCWNEKIHGKYLHFSDNLIYTGPFFIACDHGCSHGDSTHGAENSACCQDNVPPKEEIFKGCIEQISDADYIFCWIDSLDCYGTLFELGIAYEKGKKIFIGVDKNLKKVLCRCGNDFSDRPEQVGKGCCHAPGNSDNLWFVKNAGKNEYYNNPNEAWKEFLNWGPMKISNEEKNKFIKTLTSQDKEDFDELSKREPMYKVITYFKRNQKIVKKLKKLYNNKCQICEFTFKKDNGENYSETHHLIPLTNKGADDIKNLIVVCPNCHKKLNYAKKEKYDIKYNEEHYKILEKEE